MNIKNVIKESLNPIKNHNHLDISKILSDLDIFQQISDS